MTAAKMVLSSAGKVAVPCLMAAFFAFANGFRIASSGAETRPRNDTFGRLADISMSSELKKLEELHISLKPQVPVEPQVACNEPSFTIQMVREIRMSFDARIPTIQEMLTKCKKVRTKCMKVRYPTDLGYGCVERTNDLLESLWTDGLSMMLLGATTEDAYIPLVHFRNLAVQLNACFPSLNPWGWGTRYTSLPQSYELLYELLAVDLARRRRKRRLPKCQKITDITRGDFLKRLEYAKWVFRGKLELVKSEGLTQKTKSLPTQGDVEKAMKAYDLQWKPLVRSGTIDVHERYSGLGFENKCASKYFMYFDAKSQKQICCSDICKVLALSALGASSKVEMCCYNCNMAGCSVGGPSVWELALNVAGIACPMKNGHATPAAYDILL